MKAYNSRISSRIINDGPNGVDAAGKATGLPSGFRSADLTIERGSGASSSDRLSRKMLVCTTALIAPNPLLEAANHFLAVPSRICRHHAATRDAFHACVHCLMANVPVQLPALRHAVNREQADHSNYESDCECHLSSFLCELVLRY